MKEAKMKTAKGAAKAAKIAKGAAKGAAKEDLASADLSFVCIAWVVVVDDVVVDVVIVVVGSVVFLMLQYGATTFTFKDGRQEIITPTDRTCCVSVWLVIVCSCPLNTLVLEYCVVV